MLELRRNTDRGHAQHGWLDSHHTFSFADYYDPAHMGYSVLRVINEDRVAPGAGFPTHGHREMEIVTYVLAGALEHKDSMGTGSVIVPGDVQRMSAGRGIAHSEFNASKTESVHFLQIWIEPCVRGIAPGYEQKRFNPESKRAQLQLIVAPVGDDAALNAGAVAINQEARIFATLLQGSEAVTHRPARDRRVYVHVARGTITLGGVHLTAGDGVQIVGEDEIRLRATGADTAEVLLFDLP